MKSSVDREPCETSVDNRNPPDGWALILQAVKKRPEIILLLELDIGLVILADLFQFILVLMAVAYSTWIVLPWAFYEELHKRRAIEQIDWLRRAEVLLFVSGTFFVFYVFADLASGLPNLDPWIASGLLPIMKISLLLSGVIIMLLGLYLAFRVVNFYSGAKEVEHSILYWGAIPFLLFNLIVMLAQVIAFALQYSISRQLTPIGLAYFVSICLALGGTFLVIAWIQHLGNLSERFDVRGLLTLALVALPYFLLFLYYLLLHSGVSFF